MRPHFKFDRRRGAAGRVAGETKEKAEGRDLGRGRGGGGVRQQQSEILFK